MSEVPNELDWVSVRAECSPAEVFERLRQQVEADVLMRQGKQSLNTGRVFKFVSSNVTAFAVIAEETPDMWVTHNAIGRVSFNLMNHKIVVSGVGIIFERETSAPQFDATATVNSEGQCRLKIQGKELTLWQVRKMALETLFFDAI